MTDAPLIPDARQFDLIDWLAATRSCKIEANYSDPIPETRQPPVLTSRFTQWDLLLTNSTAAGRIRIIVSPRWQQKCLERLVDPDNTRIGHRILWHTGAMSRYPVPPGAKPLRCIHMTAEAAMKLHQQWPLRQEYRDPNYAWLAVTAPGEPGSELLDLPTKPFFGS